VIVLLGAWFVLRGDATAPVTPDPKGAITPKSSTPLGGTWRADGVVGVSTGSDDQPSGTRLVREWMFFDKCTQGRCQLWLSRQSADVFEDAPVHRRGDHLQAVFKRNTDGCGTPATGVLTRTFQISRTADGDLLDASEQVAANYPGCTLNGSDGYVRSSLTWKVRRFSTDCRTLMRCRHEL
jgi:hypothetical protein